ncbi:alpha/beta hydrolase [Pusillimonas sp.]|uniref:alpha/beta fold hydrolase n=1 Tax=Pusillimonas sp. TaxID=3040095 RepID=UPI0029B9AC2F|nr:alpha/beta hydrolase [Pusillimonas sp.]MDX3896185.1 alpha/beta hydrolase [Pusillimonas sp.]
MQTIQLDNNSFEYDDGGSGKTLIMMTGWCQDHRLYKNLVGPLREKYRVIRLNWRGHGADRKYDGDFVTDDQIDDVIAFVRAKGIEEFVPISASHGGWANVGIADKLGAEMVPKVIVFDWLMLSKFTDLMEALRVSQNHDTWQQGRDSLFNEWVRHTDNQDTIRHVWDEMASFDEEMWSRSCREIEHAYNKWNSPLERLTALSPSRPVAHIYSQPISADYDNLQRDFAKEHPWFKPCKIVGKTHFPALESPDAAVKIISDFVG